MSGSALHSPAGLAHHLHVHSNWLSSSSSPSRRPLQVVDSTTMSTPTTATATLPPYNPHHFPYSHHQHQAYPQANTSLYRSAASSILPASSRIGFPSPTAYSSSSSQSGTNGISGGSSTSSVRHVEPATLPPLADSHYTAMPATAQAQPVPEPRSVRKRRRSREPDWNTFYKNGLPKEIIVIDDTPEPEAAPVSSAPTLVDGHSNGITTSTDSAPRHTAKRRRRDDEPARYDPVYNTHTPRQHGSPSKSTVSSDRTNSANHTTAATSLGSLSSNGQQYDYEVQPGQKRKRTTRQQIANEAKRREALTDAFASYQPPPYPPKKANEVHVKVIPDVDFPL